MQVKIIMRLVVAAASVLAAGACFAQNGPGRARIADGELQGALSGGIVTFKGIPYAAPPVGEFRWRAPQPAPRWRGVRDATIASPDCLQSTGGMGHAESEDCLSLNVWAPATRARTAAPVMVWIHGGGFTGGSGSRYNGAAFARDGVVLVTINYRLGRLGFFAHPALAATNPEGSLANFGLMDQIAALKWVRANISAFGGDPRNVTIFGESAGAMSVNYLLTSPLARGLFDKAIAESGFARADGSSLAEARASATSFAKTLGVEGDGPPSAKALRALPAEAMIHDTPSIASSDMIGPIIDGVVAKETVATAFSTGDQAHVPFIVGGNSFEASLLPGVLKNPEGVLSRLGGKRDGAVVLFGGGDPAKAAANIVTLSPVIEPDRFQAREDAKAGVPAFIYYFSYLPLSVRSRVIGVGHGWEIAYVFDTLPKVDIPLPPSRQLNGIMVIAAATPEDEAVSRAVHAYWVAFARTGYPGAAGGPSWPAVSSAGDPVMEFGTDGPVVRPDFKKVELDIFAARADQASGSDQSGQR